MTPDTELRRMAIERARSIVACHADLLEARLSAGESPDSWALVAVANDGVYLLHRDDLALLCPEAAWERDGRSRVILVGADGSWASVPTRPVPAPAMVRGGSA